MVSPQCQDVLVKESFFQVFLEHVVVHNCEGSCTKQFLALVDEFSSSRGLIVFVAGNILTFVAVLGIFGLKKCKGWIFLLGLCFTEACALCVAFLPIMYPFKAFRLLQGWFSFSTFWWINCRIFQVGHCSDNTSISQDLVSVFSFDVGKNLVKDSSNVFHIVILFGYAFISFVLGDISLFFAREWIPLHVLGFHNQQFGMSLFMGLWLTFHIEVHYLILCIIFNYLGFPIPLVFRHRAPMVSISLSEFWGVRWNPIVQFFLKNSIYASAQQLGLHKYFCVLTSFVASASIHAIPQYFSTYDISDSMLMGVFFIVQGLFVMVEQAFQKWFQQSVTIQCSKTSLSQLNLRKERISHCHFFLEWIGEKFLLFSLFGTVLAYLEQGTVRVCVRMVLCASWLIGCFCVIFIHWKVPLNCSKLSFCSCSANSQLRHINKAAYILCGWFWTATTFILTLPCFGLPLMHAMDMLCPRSQIVRPFIDTLEVFSCTSLKL